MTLSKMARRGNIRSDSTHVSKIMSSMADLNPLFCKVLSFAEDFTRSLMEGHKPLLIHVPMAMSIRIIHTSSGVLARFMTNVPKNQRTLLSLSRGLLDEYGMAAYHSHDPRIMTM